LGTGAADGSLVNPLNCPAIRLFDTIIILFICNIEFCVSHHLKRRTIMGDKKSKKDKSKADKQKANKLEKKKEEQQNKQPKKSA
jgi:hypothetical protein